MTLGNSQFFGEQVDEGFVRSPFDRGCGDLHFEMIPFTTHDLISRRFWQEFDFDYSLGPSRHLITKRFTE
jgi:hypothetical protein